MPAPISTAGTTSRLPLFSSGGCAVGPVDSIDDLVAAADALLYRAKAAGRDRIESATADLPPA